VEKPVGNSIVECDTMVAAQKKYNRAVQCGQWQRSMQHFIDAVDFLKTGKIGQIRTVKAWAFMGWMKDIPKKPDLPQPPPGVNYDMWLGPAQKRPFNENRFHFNFRWFWDYAGGLMTDWGVHLVDYVLLGMNAPLPDHVYASGGKYAYPDGGNETPDTLAAVMILEILPCSGNMRRGSVMETITAITALLTSATTARWCSTGAAGK
jgi:predicted dehydrogenase